MANRRGKTQTQLVVKCLAQGRREYRKWLKDAKGDRKKKKKKSFTFQPVPRMSDSVYLLDRLPAPPSPVYRGTIP